MTRALREAWNEYDEASTATCAAAAPSGSTYFRRLEPTFVRIKQRADDILAINQDAMVRKSDRVRRARADLLEQLVTAAVVLASLILGLLAATWLIARVLGRWAW